MANLPEQPIWCEEYQAPDPRLPWTTGTWIKKIASRVLFPPLMVWDGLGFLVKTMAGKSMGGNVLPAQKKRFERHKKWPGDLRTETCQTPEGAVYLKRLRVKTYDHAGLDTLEVIPDSIRSVPVADRRYVIEFAGNTDCCELFRDEMVADAATLGCTVIGFNLRGVRHSLPAPHSREDLLVDGMAQVQRLLDNGVPPENIILKGHSLGGAIATLVAARFHEAGRPVCLFNDRSFSTLSNVVASRLRTIGVRQHTGHHETLFGKSLSFVCRPFIRLVLALTGWEMDAAAAWRTIPDKYKDYTVIRSSAPDRQKSFMDDTLIPHPASLHRDPGITALRKAEKRRLETAIVAMEGKHMHTAREALRLEDWYTALARLKERKIQGFPHAPNTRCHHVRRLSSLAVRRHFSSGTLRGGDFFCQFFHRVSPSLLEIPRPDLYGTPGGPSPAA